MNVEIVFAFCTDGAVHIFSEGAARPMCNAAVRYSQLDCDDSTGICEKCQREVKALARTLPPIRRVFFDGEQIVGVRRSSTPRRRR